ncbi:PREDICTED: uncharacterized protein KIAA1841 homolog [Nicrophorus vespilloides]|uniref:Uncharacterized protein KIAA1841 homolog n=1 Tax=Nicrophorus vespilloides TaxID=110193 RepID=A0ABM1NIQ3_NICVS|nr:PREDICTED: uncharacterized protein KIAA1841 homolog [Nicrophorus vespilloides]
MELCDVEKTTITVNVDKPKSKENSEITVKEFLDFLKTAYQVNDNLEGILIQEGMTDVVDWLKLKNSKFANTKPKKDVTAEHQQDANPEMAKSNTHLEEPLEMKLNEILQEGLLDSVLPYIVPSGSSSSISKRQPVKEKSSFNVQQSSSESALSRRKSSSAALVNKITKTLSEVEIHVYDELKGTKKDFICNQKLLVEQMGYFADVTKDQKLDDMDISVHCDIAIFDWLMTWMTKSKTTDGDKPQLEASAAIPILVSASFLQMESLLEECLFYCHRNMNEILKTGTNLSCLNDSILTRLAAMYTNIEVENIKDRKDKIQSRLFCKLIQSLCEVETESVRGHYCSLAYIYKCKHCQQLVSPPYSPEIPCIPSYMRLEYDGSITSRHERDPQWNINDFIVSLYKSLKTWRKVYWRLWGCAHFLYCLSCKKYFPVRQEGWCRYHPDHPQFFTMDTQKPPLPVGRYPCCGERTYRFQLLDDRTGCHCRDHTICTKDIKDASIAGLLDNYRALICEEAPRLVFPDRLTRLVARDTNEPDDGKLDSKEVLWWDGLEIVPPRQKLGLLGSICENHGESDDDEYSTHSETDDSDSTFTSSSSRHSESSYASTKKKKVTKKRNKKKMNGKLWQMSLSARSNQDLQRSNEETAFKKMTNLLNERTISSDSPIKHCNKLYTRQYNHAGGIWVRLEADWREKNAVSNSKNKNIYTGKVKMKSSKVL